MGNTFGGAKDINTFRKKLNSNSLPDVSTVTYEGLFNEYYFDTLTNIKNDDEKTYSKEEQLLIPTYCFAKCQIPKSLQLARQLATSTPSTNNDNESNNAYEYYMNVGLNENFDVNKMKRPKLNLMIVLDNSGSMSSSFDYTSSEDKMTVANKAVISLLSHLTNKDRLGVISFNSDFKIVQSLKSVKDIKMDDLKKNIMGIAAGGGTNMEMAYGAATSLYKELFQTMKQPTNTQTDTGGGDTAANDEGVAVEAAAAADDGTGGDKEAETETVKDDDKKNENKDEVKDDDEFANRIIFLTDAMPNSSNSKNSLLGMVKTNSSTQQYKGFQIHTTFIGVGIDFNTKLIEDIIKVEGGNYYSVHSNDEFMKTMDEEFKFMVTPLVYNFVLTLMAEGNSCCIEEVFGSGDDEKAILDNGEVMNVKSMFPSQHDDNDQVKGGVVVLKLKNDVNGKKNASYNMEIRSTYKDCDNKPYKLENNVMFGGGEENLSLKKDEEYFDNTGIRKSILLVRYVQLLKLWMQYQKKQSDKNKITDEYKNLFKEFIDYFKAQMELIGDKTLEKELKILNQLIK